MATKMSYERALAVMACIKAKCRAELPQGLESLRETARALLTSDDPPRGEDEAFCLAALGGNIIEG